VVAEWSKVKNWAYVSFQSPTLAGLFLEKLFHPIDFSPNPDYLEMMERLRNNILVEPIDTEQWI
jgi:hypothetical protein